MDYDVNLKWNRARQHADAVVAIGQDLRGVLINQVTPRATLRNLKRALKDLEAAIKLYDDAKKRAKKN